VISAGILDFVSLIHLDESPKQATRVIESFVVQYSNSFFAALVYFYNLVVCAAVSTF